MTTWRKRHGGMYTESKRIVGGEVKQVVCCCAAPAMKARACADAAGNKTPCRCDCHRGKTGANQ